MPRPIIGLALAAILAAAPGGALAQDYPARQIHFLQGFAPGGNDVGLANKHLALYEKYITRR